jgi:hypothetical protein
MRKIVKLLLAPAALAVVASAGIATTAAPAMADVYFGLNFGTPLFYYQPYRYYYYAPPAYYYAPSCYWDSYYGRVCY